VEIFIANDDKDSLKLGSKCLGNGVHVPISGYGNRYLFGRMLVVPGILYKIILSAGLLVSHECKLEFNDNNARLVSKQGSNILFVVRQSDHLYYVSKVSKAFIDIFTTQKPLPTLLIPVYCLVMTIKVSRSDTSSTSTIQRQIYTSNGNTIPTNTNARQRTILKRVNETRFNQLQNFSLVNY